MTKTAVRPHVAVPTPDGTCGICGDDPTPSEVHHPPGATLHLGGTAWAFPSLASNLVPIDTVSPFPGNPRRGDQDQITSSIRDHGLYAGVAVQQSTGFICVGNHRRHGLIDLGATMIPAVSMDVDDARARAIVARDNRTSDLGGYHAGEHLALLQQLQADEVPLPSMGFDDAFLAVLRRQVESEDVFTVGTDHMLDEFLAISGHGGVTGYQAEYARKVVVYLRDADAIADFSARLGITEPLTKDLNYPLGWVPDDRRKRTPEEEPADA